MLPTLSRWLDRRTLSRSLDRSTLLGWIGRSTPSGWIGRSTPSGWISRALERFRPWLAGLGPRQRVARFLVVLRAATIAAVTLAAIVAIGEASGVAFLASSLGSTVIVAYVFPESPFARPRTILAGHAVATLVGLAVATAMGPSAYGAALAVGLSIAAMQATRTMQPPAGGDPILVAAGGADPIVAAVSVMIGAVVVASGAWLWRRGGPGSGGSTPTG